VRYGEGVYVGDRYYDARRMPVAYLFGHGLTYTTFDYADLHTQTDGSGDDVRVRVRFTLTNTGAVAGKEVVQVYVGDQDSSVDRPERELKAFAKVALDAGEYREVEFVLRARDFSYYSTTHGRWFLEPGAFDVRVGASSRDLRLAATVTVDAPVPRQRLTTQSTIGQWLAHPEGGPVLKEAMASLQGSAVASDPEIMRMVESLPLSRLIALSGGRLDLTEAERLLARTDSGA
jgi:beta-glucosidase